MNLYGVLKKTTVHGRPTIFESITAFTEAEDACKAKGLKLAASTYCEGYINNGTAVCVPYDGQYGRGFILCSQHFDPFTWKPSTKYMDIEYWVYPKE